MPEFKCLFSINVFPLMVYHNKTELKKNIKNIVPDGLVLANMRFLQGVCRCRLPSQFSHLFITIIIIIISIFIMIIHKWWWQQMITWQKWKKKIFTELVSLDVMEPIYYEPSSRWLRYKERVSQGWEKIRKNFFSQKKEFLSINVFFTIKKWVLEAL